MSAQEQIDKLANYIMEFIPGEPSQSEGAGDTAIRLLREYRKVFADIYYTLLEDEDDALNIVLDILEEVLYAKEKE
jgi:hypothetical protein